MELEQKEEEDALQQANEESSIEGLQADRGRAGAMQQVIYYAACMCARMTAYNYYVCDRS